MKKILLIIFIFISIFGFSQGSDIWEDATVHGDLTIINDLSVDDYLRLWNGAEYDTITASNLLSLYSNDGTFSSARTVDVNFVEYLIQNNTNWLISSQDDSFLDRAEGIRFNSTKRDTIRSNQGLALIADTVYLEADFYKFETNPSSLESINTVLNINTATGQVGTRTIPTSIYGEFYEDAANTATITTDYATIGSLTGAGAFDAVLNNGVSSGVTLNDSTMTIVTAGIYKIDVSNSFTHSTNGAIIHFSVFVNDVENTKGEAERKIGNGGDIGNGGLTCMLDLSVSDVLKIKIKSSSSGTLTINHFNWNITKIK